MGATEQPIRLPAAKVVSRTTNDVDVRIPVTIRSANGRAAIPFFTIGHSTRPVTDFVGLLRVAHVDVLVDVRTVPRSRTNPQYNQEALSAALSEFKIDYVHIAELGGLRGKQRNIATHMNAFWINDSFHNYADYAMTEPFQRGLGRLRKLGHTRRCAIMCAEALWWRCHRRIIADYLLNAGERVFHIRGENHIEVARLTCAARRTSCYTLAYPA
ncbi:hypothetical protein D8I24_5503 (plasmid) [Cupriavidus necator H850]|uniref:DUF488 domain-containing protein n=1 Tax=Cupriavidus necator TaxID=106590 RepID=UPI00129DE892|nr:DUF488 domain-containing protein [Cupriavidus necator]KAI3599145.1 hypothetical protein D8I24_5503 [Cupriavidus necator H850]